MNRALEKVLNITSLLMETGLEWTLGPLVLLQIVTGNVTSKVDLAIHIDDFSNNIVALLERIGIDKVFYVVNRGFSNRCIYAWGLPCISIEDMIVSFWHDKNKPYRGIVLEILQRTPPNTVDWGYIRNIALRLKILDNIEQALTEAGLDKSCLKELLRRG